MSRTEALARASVLRESLLDHGVRKVSIELQQGRPGTPNDQWWDDRFVMEMSHHTVSRPSQGLTPCLALVKRGRSDVPGPLCNGYGGYDLVYRIICMGWANHPGAGGPLTIAGFRIPMDTARPYAWGTEYEGGLEPWTDSFREFMGRSNAGILDWLGRPVDAHGEHKTWAPDRKIDRLGYTTTSGRAEVAHWVDATTPAPDDEEDWFDMRSDAQIMQLMRNAIVASEDDLTQYAANGVDQAMDGTNVPKKLRQAIWADQKVKRGVDANGNDIFIPVIQELADAKTQAIAVGAKVAGLEAALKAGGLDLAAIEVAIEGFIESAMSRVRVVVED